MISLNERVEIIYDKYELLKQVKEVIALEPQDIEYKDFIQATFGSMENGAWSIKAATEQEAWDKERDSDSGTMTTDETRKRSSQR